MVVKGCFESGRSRADLSHVVSLYAAREKKQGRTMFEKKVRLCFFFFFFTCLEEVNSSVWISRVGTGCSVERSRRDSLPLRSHCGRHGTGLWDSEDFCRSTRMLLHERWGGFTASGCKLIMNKKMPRSLTVKLWYLCICLESTSVRNKRMSTVTHLSE